jgi:hypothetical protein
MAHEREIAPDPREVLMCPHGIVIVVHCNKCRTIWTQPEEAAREVERDRSRLPAGEWTASERVRLAAAVHKWVYLHPPMRPWTPALVDSLLDALAAALPPVPSEGDAK